MSENGTPYLAWKRSSRSSTGPDSNCVEVAFDGNAVHVRDSKQVTPAGYDALNIDRAGWGAILQSITVEPS